jgi:uncharacterized membrane protein SpoIIM required for sporulation
MVLESLLNVEKAENKPWLAFAVAFLYTIISVFFSQKLFPSQSSILSIALITFLFIPFFQKLFSVEEKKDLDTRKNIIARHDHSIMVFSAFFMGVILATTFVYTFFPSYENTFVLQTDTIKSFAGAVTQEGNFSKFFFNNTKVMVLTFILAALWGAGSILVLAWNASIIGVYIGIIIRSVGLGTVESFLFGLPLGLGSIALHGIPEVVAYFIAGLAGGILSVGLIKENVKSQQFKNIFKDSIKFLLIAEMLIIAAAWLEAFV